MTQEYFINLQKAVYNRSMDDEWASLFEKYNKLHGTTLSIYSRNHHIIVLKAIAEKQKFEFHPLDLQKYSPIKML